VRGARGGSLNLGVRKEGFGVGVGRGRDLEDSERAEEEKKHQERTLEIQEISSART